MPKYMTNLHSLSIIPPVRKLHTRILATLNGISSGTPPESISRIKWLRLPAIIPIRKAFSIPFVLPITGRPTALLQEPAENEAVPGVLSWNGHSLSVSAAECRKAARFLSDSHGLSAPLQAVCYRSGCGHCRYPGAALPEPIRWPLPAS